MDGELVDDVEETGEGSCDQVFVVTMGNAVDAAVEDVNAVVGVLGTAGEDEGVAAVKGAVDAGGGSSDLEGALDNKARTEVDDGHVGRVGVGDEDTAGLPGGNHVVVVRVVVFGVIVFVCVVVLDNLAGRGGGFGGGGWFGTGVVTTGDDEEGGGQDGRESDREPHGTRTSQEKNRFPGAARAAGSETLSLVILSIN